MKIIKSRCVPAGDKCPQRETSPKGVTLITLAITIVIMLIIAGVSISVGGDSIESARVSKFNAELRIIHTKVNEIVEENLPKEELNALGQDISTLDSTIQNKISTALEGSSVDGFRYFNATDLEALGVIDVDREVIIKFTTREVVDINGVKSEGNYIYRLEGWNNIEYQEPLEPKFNLSKKVYGLTATIHVTDIVGNGNEKISYCLFNNETEGVWRSVSGKEFTVEQSGIYKVRLADSTGKVIDKTIEVALANKPKLDSGMTPVIYDATLGKWKKVEENSGEWYDYASDKKQWANVMLQDGLVVNEDGTIDEENMGSMFVWVPRYMYQIPAENYHTSTAGEIQIKFLQETTNIATDGTNVDIANESGGDNWNVHPAFCDGTKNNYANGEWDKEITGIWVAKFEASSSNNTATYGGGDTTELDVKVLPNVNSWGYISVSNMYTVCKNMVKDDNIYNLSNNVDTHMMKNSEWGAVAYIAKSKYGKNMQVWNNPYIFYSDSNDMVVLTGKASSAENGADVGSTTSCDSYNEGNGPNGSTTGNVYGVYDMAGGKWEYVASYINNSYAQNSSDITSLREAEPKYKRVYSVTDTDTEQGNYELNSKIYGDAVFETSMQGTSTTAWEKDYSTFPSGVSGTLGYVMFKRGGRMSYTTEAGLFTFSSYPGNTNEQYTFRPVCIVE